MIPNLDYYKFRAREIIKEEGVFSLGARAIKKLFKFTRIPDQNQLYKRWIDLDEAYYLNAEKKIYKNEIESYKIKPKISILMPVYNVDPKILEEAIESVESQWYGNWELCMYDDCSTNLATLDFLEKFSSKISDQRIKFKRGKQNLNISLATNEAFKLSSGEYIMLMDNDDVLAQNALYEVVKTLNNMQEEKLALIYFDEDKLDKFGQRIEPFFKPDFSPELLLSMMYPTHALFSRSTFEKTGMMRKGYEGSQDYDLVLRVSELIDISRIAHIPQVLYHWRKTEGSTAENISGKSYAIVAAKKALEDALERRKLEGKVLNDHYPFVTKLSPWKGSENSTVEIIIPIKDKIDYLQRCVDSIKANTKSANVKITIINNDSREKKSLDYLTGLKSSKELEINVIDYHGKYNFAAINNFGVSKSDANYLIFLNNDTQIITDGWIDDLFAWAEQDEIAAVGPKLLYGNRSVQHAGIVLGAGGVANHVYYKMPEATDFYFNHLHATRNYLALTAACMMVSRKKFNEVGGFNEDLPLSYNDVDLCLKLFEKGYRNVYVPYVEVIHYESRSRNPKVLPHEDEYMLGTWKKYIDHDPYYNPNLSRNIKEAPIFSVRKLK